MSFSDLEIVGRNVLKIYEFSQCCRSEKKKIIGVR